MAEIEKMGIHVELGERFGATGGGYLGIATFQMFDYQPIGVEINISTRNDVVIKGEVDSIANNFVPTYTVIHLPQNEIVEEKIFGALLERKKLGSIKDSVVADAKQINFKDELGAFLPIGQQGIIKDFSATLGRELNSQLSGV